MNDSDVGALVGVFLSAFGLGIISSYLLRVFLRAAGFIAR
jgi:hypothetical protein